MRRTPSFIALTLLAAACTSHGPVAPSPSASPGSTTASLTPTVAPLVLQVMATTSGAQADQDRSYLDGMRLAIREVNAAGGVAGRPVAIDVHDDGGSTGTATSSIRELLGHHPRAILYVGPGSALTPVRTAFERAGTPVILLEGDLYSSRGLFPQVFQTTIPWEWQAKVIARYVVLDRRAKDIVFVGTGPEAPLASQLLSDALAYWGGRLAASFDDRTRDPSAGLTKAFARAAKSDWAVVFGPPVGVLELTNGIEEAAGFGDVTTKRPAPGISGPASLLATGGGLARPQPGTTACNTYTWAGWAQAIPRVAAFRLHFAQMAGHGQTGLEQEGYDAVWVLARALARTDGAGGAKLAAALEGTHLTLSSYPVDLGPDDHVFLPRDGLGLFAVAGPQERLDPWQIAGTEPWRPVMRTFTYDGTRTDVLDMDRKVFFPFWDKNQPGPEFWRSRYGIASRSSDRLH